MDALRPQSVDRPRPFGAEYLKRLLCRDRLILQLREDITHREHLATRIEEGQAELFRFSCRLFARVDHRA